MNYAGGALAAFLWLGPGAALEAHEVSAKGVTVAHPWVRANAGGTTVTAAFMEIRTGAATADKLISVSTPAAGRVELHAHVKEGDVMKMRALAELGFSPGESHILMPSGDHIMLLDLKAPLREGDLVKLTLSFADAGPLEIEATVEPEGALGPHGMDHQPGREDDHEHGGKPHRH